MEENQTFKECLEEAKENLKAMTILQRFKLGLVIFPFVAVALFIAFFYVLLLVYATGLMITLTLIVWLLISAVILDNKIREDS